MSKKSLIILLSLCGVFVLGFMSIALILSANNYSALAVDTAVAQFFYSIRGEYGGFIYWFFRIFTEMGYTYIIVAVVLIYAICNKFRLNSWLFAGATLFTWGFQKLLKLIFDRPRPDPSMWWMVENSSSFPSGHSMMAVFVFTILAYLIIKSSHACPWLKRLALGISIFAIIIVPISRLILGVHYFTDVLGGMFIGGALALLFIILHSYFTKSTSTKTQSPP